MSKIDLKNIGLNLDSSTCINLFNKYPQFKDIFDILFRQTEYYTMKDILKDLEVNIKKWISERDNSKELFIVLPVNDKIGSEHYFYYHFKDILPKHTVLTSSAEKLIEDVEYLYLDDWSLSGVNLLYSFENILYKKYGKDYSKGNLQLTAIVSIITPSVEKMINEIFPSYKHKIYYSHIINKLDKYLNEIPEELKQEFYKTFSPATENASYPIHLDYKIANQFGSYPTIYLKCREPPVKNFMEETEKYFKKYLKE